MIKNKTTNKHTAHQKLSCNHHYRNKTNKTNKTTETHLHFQSVHMENNNETHI